MQISDLRTYLAAEVAKYTGPETLYFGSGTDNELNAFEQIKETNPLGYPIVWLMDDPDLLSIRSLANDRKEIVFTILILFQSTLDAPPSETEDIYNRAGLIGEGIVYNLANRSEYSGKFSMMGWDQMHRLKIQDNVLTGCAFRAIMSVPIDPCIYPFEPLTYP